MGVSHVLQLVVPTVIVGSCVTSMGAKTTTLLSGFFAAGSNTVPEMVVCPPPGQFEFTVQPAQADPWLPPSSPNAPLEPPLPPPLLPKVAPPESSSPPPSASAPCKPLGFAPQPPEQT